MKREALPHAKGLAGRLVLAYTGQPRQSGFSNWDMFKRFVEGDKTTVARMNEIARLARAMRDALAAGAIDDAGRLLGEEGRLRYRLAPSVSTPTLERVGMAARRAGALGVKVCGAGGGGCLVAFAAQGKQDAVAAAMEAAGAAILPVEPAARGVEVSAP
jgi:D-glycero-alpha-D-manno-heptose-7-phosphate kinase